MRSLQTTLVVFLMLLTVCVIVISNDARLHAEESDVVVVRVADKLIAKPGENIIISTIIENNGLWTITNISFFFIIPYPSNVTVMDNLTGVSRTATGCNVSFRYNGIISPKSVFIHNVTVSFAIDGNYTIMGGRTVLTLRKGEYILEKVTYRVNDISITIRSGLVRGNPIPGEGKINAYPYVTIVIIAPFLIMKSFDKILRVIRKRKRK